MSSLTMIDMITVDTLFERENEPGYVLNFSNPTFTQFFAHLKINIDDPKYAANGISKGRRLKCFLQLSDNATALKVLKSLWDYREAIRAKNKLPETVEDALGKFHELVGSLGGVVPKAAPVATPASRSDVAPDVIKQLASDLLAITSLEAQKRGYAFEKFLKSLFDAYGMQGRASFKLVGEQIDGSFQLDGATYLVEAKWQAAQTGAADLHAFNGKLSTKAAWSRGLFISYSGFTEGGLDAFGAGTRTICMDGRDLFEVINGNRRFDDVLALKSRRAVETGKPFIRVGDL